MDIYILRMVFPMLGGGEEYMHLLFDTLAEAEERAMFAWVWAGEAGLIPPTMTIRCIPDVDWETSNVTPSIN